MGSFAPFSPTGVPSILRRSKFSGRERSHLPFPEQAIAFGIAAMSHGAKQHSDSAALATKERWNERRRDAS
ncbi:hypothetical protein [Allocoleopsis sp.]|uniref:hypothetical protein n=1 Tax=Allocoleopsis sp. TaxID=3088169 RepID=UPI002FD77B04